MAYLDWQLRSVVGVPSADQETPERWIVDCVFEGAGVGAWQKSSIKVDLFIPRGLDTLLFYMGLPICSWCRLICNKRRQ